VKQKGLKFQNALALFNLPVLLFLSGSFALSPLALKSDKTLTNSRYPMQAKHLHAGVRQLARFL